MTTRRTAERARILAQLADELLAERAAKMRAPMPTQRNAIANPDDVADDVEARLEQAQRTGVVNALLARLAERDKGLQ